MTTLMDKRTERRFREISPSPAIWIEEERAQHQAPETFYRRERPFKIRWSAVAVWGGILAFCGFAWGFFFFVIAPLVHKLLERLNWW